MPPFAATMVIAAEKLAPVIDDACERLIARAENSRTLAAADVRARVSAAVGKYLFRSSNDGASATAPPDLRAVRTFIDELRADDLCLVIACERGDEEAWRELVAAFDPVVRSAARKVSANAKEAEDLAGSIWAELYGLRQDAEGNRKSKLAYFTGRGSLGGWLRAVVEQLAVDHFRKGSRLVTVDEPRDFDAIIEDAARDGRANGFPGSAPPSPEQVVADAEATNDLSAAIKAAIDQLEAEDKLVLKLYHFDGLTLKEIGTAFGFHEATASRKIARLHAEIRKAVERELAARHGWQDQEIKRYLTEISMKLGSGSVEKLFVLLVIAAFVQGSGGFGVQ